MSSKGDTQAAFHAHEDSSLLNRRVMGAAQQSSKPVFRDGAGDKSIEKLEAAVRNYKSSGYKVEANYVTLDIGTARKRNNEQYRKTGRKVPNKLLQNTHTAVSQILPEAIKSGLFDHVTLWDTGAGGEPIRVAEAFGTNLTIYRNDLLEQFVAKGK